MSVNTLGRPTKATKLRTIESPQQGWREAAKDTPHGSLAAQRRIVKTEARKPAAASCTETATAVSETTSSRITRIQMDRTEAELGP